MVTSNALHIETRLVLVERVRGKVQHTEVKGLVLQDMVYGCRLLNGFLTDRLRDEHLVVQITLVNLPHIEETENGEESYKPFRT